MLEGFNGDSIETRYERRREMNPDSFRPLWLLSKIGTNPYRQTYTYDPTSNRTLKNVGGTRTSYAYDAANQLIYSQVIAGRTTFTFDAAGNQQVTRDPTNARTTTTWNFENQPTLYKLPAGARVTCLYNADNRQVRKEK